MTRLTIPAADPAANGATPPAETTVAPTPPVLLYSATDLCYVLRVSRATLDRLRAAGRLPRPLRLGGQWRWLREEIEAWTRAGMPDARTWEALRAAANANGRR